MNSPGWFRDRTLQKIAKYGLPVAIGKFASAGSGLVSLAILARYLGVELFGVLAMFRTMVITVELFANFNTWQAIVKYGTEAIAKQRRMDVERVIKLAFVIDVVTAALGAGVIIGLAFIVPGTFGWSARDSLLCALYALVLISKVSGTSDGIFRICDAYRAQAIVTSITAIATMVVAIVAVAVEASFAGCVVALVTVEVAGNVVVTASSLRVAKASGYGGWPRASLQDLGVVFPGIRHFMVSTNAHLTVRTAQGELDMIIAGSVLGKAGAGLFRVNKQLGTIPGRFFNSFEQVVFTELARCSAARDYGGFGKLLRRVVAITAAGTALICVTAAIVAAPLIELVAGEKFLGAAPSLRWYMLAIALHVISFPILRAMIALGRPGTLLVFDLFSLGVLATTGYFGAKLWGLVGIAVALVLHRAIQLVWSSAFVWHFIRTAATRLEKSGMNEPVGDL